MTRKVLIILTSHDRMGETGKPTGFWAEEFAEPYYALTDAGLSVDVVSVKGGKAPIDPSSLQDKGENPASVERMLDDADLMARLDALPAVETVADADYDAVFLPGGHGTMWDYPGSDALVRQVVKTYEAGKPVAAVCHGPAGLVSARLSDGSALVAGKRVAAFTNSEEVAVGLKEVVPFLLEDRLRELGATVETKDDFEPHVIVDGHLITGQNPPSSKPAAEKLIEALNAR